jgi:hypothetical protein
MLVAQNSVLVEAASLVVFSIIGQRTKHLKIVRRGFQWLGK